MPHNVANNKGLSPKDRSRKAADMAYLLLMQGYNQKQTAAALDLNPKTINLWVKEFGWKKKIAQLGRTKVAASLKLDESLTAFMRYLRIYHRDLFEQLEPAYKTFLKKF